MVIPKVANDIHITVHLAGEDAPYQKGFKSSGKAHHLSLGTPLCLLKMIAGVTTQKMNATYNPGRNF